MSRIVCWFSCGAASAVATKLALARFSEHEVVVARCIVPEEHPDGERFAADCEAWFGQPALALRSADYASCEEVWTHRRYMSGTKGAPCTIEMKKAVRWVFEREWNPDAQVFGYTDEEGDRIRRFRRENPEINFVNPLVDAHLTKQDCHAIIARAGIKRHAMYDLGFPNGNCIGCVKMDSSKGWNLTREHFPEVFAARATLSRKIGCRLVKTTAAPRERLFLDELPPDMDVDGLIPDEECSLLCHAAEQVIALRFRLPTRRTTQPRCGGR